MSRRHAAHTAAGAQLSSAEATPLSAFAMVWSFPAGHAVRTRSVPGYTALTRPQKCRVRVLGRRGQVKDRPVTGAGEVPSQHILSGCRALGAGGDSGFGRVGDSLGWLAVCDAL